MAKQSPSSFEAEFNRLSFLASIATGTSETTTTPTQNTFESFPAGTNSVNFTQKAPQQVGPSRNYNENVGFTPSKTVNTPTEPSVNGLHKGNQPISNRNINLDIQKINSILLNASAQGTTTSQQNLILKAALKQQQAKTFLAKPNNQQQQASRIIITTTTRASPLQKTISQVIAPTATKTKVTQAVATPQVSLTIPGGQFTNRTAIYSQQHLQKLTAAVKTTTKAAALTSGMPTLNPPLIISTSPARSSQATVTNTGQTILLPANFAGMSGKVLIVNNPGKPPQAIAINQSSVATPQTMVSIQSSSGNKPVLLLPNNSTSQANINQTMAQLQQHSTQQLNNSPVRMVIAQNNSQQVQVRNRAPQQMPQLTPVSLSSFQNIRPKSMLQPVRSIQPKVVNLNSAATNKVLIATSGLHNKGIRLSHFQGLQGTSQKQIIPTAVTITPSQVTVPQTMGTSIMTIKGAPGAGNVSLLKNFDKTMTEHLQTLEKTDPHLFMQNKSGKLQINPAKKIVSTTSVENSPNKIQQLQQEKLKMYLQSQLQQQQQHLAASAANDNKQKQLTTILTQQQRLQQQLLLQQQQQASNISKNINPTILTSQNNAGTQSIKSTLMPQLLATVQQTPTSVTANATQSQQQINITTPQKQQAVLQNILKQHQQFNKQIRLTTTSKQQQQQQQQQLASQLVAAVAAAGQKPNAQSLELYLLQQKLLEAQSQQSKPQTIQTASQLSQLTKQMIKPKMETSIKKVIHQQQPLQQQPLQQLNTSLIQMNSSNQPLKLLSSLTNMVNSSSASSIKIGSTPPSITSVPNRTMSNLVNIVNPIGSMNTQGIRPVLFQLAATGNSNIASKASINTMQLTNSQLLELQKTLLATQAANRTNIATPMAGGVQIPNTSLTLNSKFSNQQTAAHSKSAFGQRLNAQPTVSNTNQAQINQLIQQGILISNSNSLPALQKTQTNNTSAFINKTFQEQIKNLTPAQRELLIKQYTASGKLANPQIQSALQNTANPILLASILKNRQAVPTAMSLSMSPKGVVTNQQQQQPLKKVTKASKSYKRTITEVQAAQAQVLPKEPEESPLTKRWKSLLQDDQQKYIAPSYKKPFASYGDAFLRLRPFHLSYETERDQRDKDKFELLFNGFSNNVQDRKNALLSKFHHLVLRESRLEWPSADDILMGRLFECTEKERFELQKKAVADGRSFVVKNENNMELECVELSVKEETANENNPSNNLTLHLSEEDQLDNRLRIASKDIGNIEIATGANEEDDDEEEEEEEEEEEIDNEEYIENEEYNDNDNDNDANGNMTEEIEIEEVAEDLLDYGEDNELAAATTNLLADLEQDDDDDDDDDFYSLDFE